MITEIKSRNRTRSDLYCDGVYALTVNTAAIKGRLDVGDELDPDAFLQEIFAEEFATALERSYTYLEVRMRSEQEVRNDLKRHGYPVQICDAVVEKLKAQRFIDDALFSNLWSESKLKSHSLSAVKRQLRQKGIDRELIGSIESDPEKEQAKCRAIARKYYLKAGDDQASARRKAVQALARRGYAWETIKHALAEWDEQIDEIDFFQ